MSSGYGWETLKLISIQAGLPATSEFTTCAQGLCSLEDQGETSEDQGTGAEWWRWWPGLIIRYLSSVTVISLATCRSLTPQFDSFRICICSAALVIKRKRPDTLSSTSSRSLRNGMRLQNAPVWLPVRCLSVEEPAKLAPFMGCNLCQSLLLPLNGIAKRAFRVSLSTFCRTIRALRCYTLIYKQRNLGCMETCRKPFQLPCICDL
jgi:hypothetical protein